jgi:hypothetical protein
MDQLQRNNMTFCINTLVLEVFLKGRMPSPRSDESAQVPMDW